MNVIDMQIMQENNFAVISLDGKMTNEGIVRKPVYVEYSMDGIELERIDFSHLLPELSLSEGIIQTVFMPDRCVILSIAHERENVLYFIDIEKDNAAAIKLDSYHQENSIVIAQDSRVIVFDPDSGELRVADFENEKWSDIYPVQGGRDTKLYPAYQSSGYDFLVSDNSNLYGYILDTGEQVKLISWVESGFINMSDTHIGMIDENRFVAALKNRNTTGLDLEFYLLTPSSRDDIPDKIVLTLGCMWLHQSWAKEVIKFNRESSTHVINVIEYTDSNGDWEAGMTRLQMELMTGNGPDIILDQGGVLRNQKVLLDIYPFIDADPDINREDFFPSVLKAMENRDGTLTRLYYSFDLLTMIGTKDTVGHIEKWTLDELFMLISENTHMLNPFGVSISADQFISQAISFSGTKFIDMQNYTANVDNEDFIAVLEIAKVLSETAINILEIDNDSFPRELWTSQFVRLNTGKQLVELLMLYNAEEFQYRAEFLGDNLVILGMPTSEGGQHSLRFGVPIAINTATEHPEVAWSFVREFLLSAPDDDSIGFPVRIDAFEAYLADLQTPRMGLDEDDKPIEIPRDQFFTSEVDDSGVFSVHDIEVYALTDEVANMLREMIYTATPQQGMFYSEISNMLIADAKTFFDGGRTVEDTARILQNRLQTYLSEMELMS